MTTIINSKPFFYVITLIFSLLSLYVGTNLTFTVIVWSVFAAFTLYLIFVESLRPPIPVFAVVLLVLTGGMTSPFLPLLFLILPYVLTFLDQTHYFLFSSVAFVVMLCSGDFRQSVNFTVYVVYILSVIGVWIFHRRELLTRLFGDKERSAISDKKIEKSSSSIIEDPFKPLKSYLARTDRLGETKMALHLVELLPNDTARIYNSETLFKQQGLLYRVVHNKTEVATKTLLAEQEDIPMMPEFNFRLYYPINVFVSDPSFEPEFVLAVDIKIKEEETVSKEELLLKFREVKDDIVEYLKQAETFRQISIEKQKNETVYRETSNIVDSFNRDSLFHAAASAIFNLVPEAAGIFIAEQNKESHIGHAFKLKEGVQKNRNLTNEQIEEFAKAEIDDPHSIHYLMATGKLDNIYESSGLYKREESPLFTQHEFDAFNKMDGISARLITFNGAIKGSISILTATKEDLEALSNHTTSILMIYKVVASALNNIEMYEKVEDLSNIDGLTKLFNRRYFQDTIARMVMESSRTGNSLSMIMLDIDHFKKVNDTYGHKAGDDVLRFLARTIKNNVRKVDIAARYGGEEFVVLLHNTSSQDAVRLAEKIRVIIQDSIVNADGSRLSITASFGISAYPLLSLSAEQLVKNADEALYFSKEHGRNQVTLFDNSFANSAAEKALQD